MDKYRERISALLRKAESTDSVHEAEALTKKAEQLMIKWGVEDLVEDAQTGRAAQVVKAEFTYSEVGAKYLASAMAKTFGHQIVWGLLGDRAKCVVMQLPNRVAHLIVVGHDRDMARLRSLHDSLVIQALHALEVWVSQCLWWSGLTPSQKQRDRIQFMAGFANTVMRRLEAMRATDEVLDGSVSSALAVRRNDLDDRFRELFPRVRKSGNMKGGSQWANDAGSAAGRSAHFGQSLQDAGRGQLR